MTKSASESPRNEPEPVPGAGRTENRSQGQEGAGMAMTARSTMPDTETLTPEQVAEIEARYELATPGPWQARFIYRIFESARRDPINLFGAQQEQDWPDCDFIANARADIPALCRSLRAAWQWKREALPLLTRYDNLAETFDGSLGSSKVANLERGVAALREQLATQAESITYFQENEKSLKAQLAEVEQERDDALMRLRIQQNDPTPANMEYEL